MKKLNKVSSAFTIALLASSAFFALPASAHTTHTAAASLSAGGVKKASGRHTKVHTTTVSLSAGGVKKASGRHTKVNTATASSNGSSSGKGQSANSGSANSGKGQSVNSGSANN